MAELAYISFALPSRGRLYHAGDGSAIPDGKVEIRKMLAPEQALLEDSLGPFHERLVKLVRACVKFPTKDFQVESLLLSDFMTLVIAVRSYSLGTRYEVRYDCRRCRSKEMHSVDIKEDFNEKSGGLSIEGDEPSLYEPLLIALPDEGKTVSVRFSRVRDVAAIERHTERVKSLRKGAGTRDVLLFKMAVLIQKVGDESVDVLKAIDFLREITASDYLVIDQTLEKAEPGLDTMIFPKCENCGQLNDMPAPLTPEFLRPDRIGH